MHGIEEYSVHGIHIHAYFEESNNDSKGSGRRIAGQAVSNPLLRNGFERESDTDSQNCHIYRTRKNIPKEKEGETRHA